MEGVFYRIVVRRDQQVYINYVGTYLESSGRATMLCWFGFLENFLQDISSCVDRLEEPSIEDALDMYGESHAITYHYTLREDIENLTGIAKARARWHWNG